MRYQSRSNLPLIFAACFLAFIATAVIAGRLPRHVLVLYLVASFVAFIAYALDKSAAVKNQRRTPENTLHLFALVGGWPGALVAQRWLRHKTAKVSFQVTFWITVLLNCSALGWMLSPDGAKVIHSILGAT